MRKLLTQESVRFNTSLSCTGILALPPYILKLDVNCLLSGGRLSFKNSVWKAAWSAMLLAYSMRGTHAWLMSIFSHGLREMRKTA